MTATVAPASRGARPPATVATETSCTPSSIFGSLHVSAATLCISPVHASLSQGGGV